MGVKPPLVFSHLAASTSRLEHLLRNFVSPLLLPVKLLEDQMQEQIDVKPQTLTSTPTGTLEEIHELVSVKLRLQQVIQWNARTCSRNHQRTH